MIPASAHKALDFIFGQNETNPQEYFDLFPGQLKALLDNQDTLKETFKITIEETEEGHTFFTPSKSHPEFTIKAEHQLPNDRP